MNAPDDGPGSTVAVAEDAVAGDVIATFSAIWARVLDLPDIQADDNFFDLGGDSMIAVTLFAEIERIFGRALPITAIYDAPTVRQLAALVERSAAPAFSHLVLLNEGAGGRPLFVVHGIGGAIMEIGRIVGFMRAPGPIYGVQAQGFGDLPPLDDLAVMVEHYVAAVRSVSPHGPYLLAGYSFGGLVALEMARVLGDAGEAVDLLVMIDSYPTAAIWPWFLRFDCRCRQALQRLRSLAKGGFPAIRSYANELFSKDRSPNKRRPFPLEANVPASIERVQIAAEQALATYRPGYYAGDVVFVAADESSPSFPRHPRLMWQKLTASLDIYGVSATHRGMMGPQADRLADTLSMLYERHARDL